MKLILVLSLGLIASLSAVSASSYKKVETLTPSQIEQQMNEKLEWVGEITTRRYQRSFQVYR